MRYVGLLPNKMNSDGRLSWECDEFLFNDVVRKERLNRAIDTHLKPKKGGKIQGGKIKGKGSAKRGGK